MVNTLSPEQNGQHIGVHNLKLKCILENKNLMYDFKLNFGNTLRLRQNSHHFANNFFKSIFLNENIWISINIQMKFLPKGQINNIPVLVQKIAWHWPGDKPLSEPMMISFLMHIWTSLCLSELMGVCKGLIDKNNQHQFRLVMSCWATFY